MSRLIAAALPLLLPRAIRWCEGLAADVAARGAPLLPAAVEDARSVGVEKPEAIRVLIVDEMPAPRDLLLAPAAAALGFLGSDTAGLALGHAIFVRRGQLSRRMLTHECRHVAQCEAAGSLPVFLEQYLTELLAVGYEACSFERDARAHELPNADLRWRGI
jgi:hypothetical protein